MEGATRDSPAHWSDGVRHQPAEVLELSPYPWDCVALQFRRNIVLRPGTQRSSPFAQEQRDSRSRDSEGRAAPLIRAYAAELHGSESDGTAKPATTPPLSRRCSMRSRECCCLHAVERDLELFSTCDRATGFGHRFAVRGDGVSGLENRLAVLLDRYVEGARGRVFHGDGEARRHHPAGAGVILAVELRVARHAHVGIFKAQPIGPGLRDLCDPSRAGHVFRLPFFAEPRTAGNPLVDGGAIHRPAVGFHLLASVGEGLAVGVELQRVGGSDFTIDFPDDLPRVGVDGLPGAGSAHAVGVVLDVHFEFVRHAESGGLPFAAGQAFVGDGGLAEIALGQVHLPLAGVRQVGGKCGADERAEQKQACLHVYPPFDFAIMARRAMECKGRSRFSRNVYVRLRVRYCPPPGTEIHLAEALPADQRLRAYAQRIAHAHHHVPVLSAKRSMPGDSARLEDKWKNWGFSDAEIKEREYWDQYIEAFTFAVRSALQPRFSL